MPFCLVVCTSYRTVQSTIWTIFSEFKDFWQRYLGEENKSRIYLNEENMSILYEKPCDNLFIVNILFFYL